MDPASIPPPFLWAGYDAEPRGLKLTDGDMSLFNFFVRDGVVIMEHKTVIEAARHLLYCVAQSLVFS